MLTKTLVSSENRGSQIRRKCKVPKKTPMLIKSDLAQYFRFSVLCH